MNSQCLCLVSRANDAGSSMLSPSPSTSLLTRQGGGHACTGVLSDCYWDKVSCLYWAHAADPLLLYKSVLGL